MNLSLERLFDPVRPPTSGRLGVTLLVAGALHLSVGMAAASLPHVSAPPAPPGSELSLLAEEPPPPSPPPAVEPEPAPEPPRPSVVAPAAAPRSQPAARAEAPPAAAANVLTARDDAPADLTGGMVIGAAESYAGGTTSTEGTGTRPGGGGATRAPASVAASAPAPTRPGPGLSRPARLADGVAWNCPFPPEADQQGIDDAVVGLRIDVDPGGQALSVVVESEPMKGFGRVAVACARTKRFSPALDHDGLAIAGRARVNVRFHR